MRKLKLYTDLSLIGPSERPVELLIPFLKQDDFEKDINLNICAGRFDDFERVGSDFLELTSLEECDACVLPVNYPQSKQNKLFEDRIQNFSDRVNKSGKRTFVFIGADLDDFDVKISNSIIFHNSLYQSHRRSNEYSAAFFFEDFVQKYCSNQLSIRQKESVPIIGFCGFAPPISQKWGKSKLKEVIRLALNYLGFMHFFPSKSAHSYRAKALYKILRSNKVKKNIVIRKKFGFGGQFGQLFPGGSPELNEIYRRDYVQNMIASDYILCVRGIGNNSIRFYEALCCGRIPIFVNTDCVLPFDFAIDWKKYCVWVEESEINKISEKVLDFHNNLSNERFQALQREVREIWNQYFSPVGFYKNLHLHL